MAPSPSNKTSHSKKAQISTEVLYAVGAMIIVFIILTGISFNKQSDLRRLEDYLAKRNECYKTADLLSTLWVTNDHITANVRFKYYVDVHQNGAITVRDATEDPRTIEAHCTYNAHYKPPSGTTGTYNPGDHTIKNDVHTVTIT